MVAVRVCESPAESVIAFWLSETPVTGIVTVTLHDAE